jgi:predicted nucleotidyltransferase
MEDTIKEQLTQIAQSEDVRIVFACESGSRAWGFPSADSDYDVRFLYVQRPEWYLRIDPGRDVIERPISEGLDINGWDLRKALQLFRKSNPPLMEWLGSPIVYREVTTIASQMRDLAPAFYSPIASTYHYLQMARRNYREFLRGETVWVKKYFYVLRPMMAARWIELGLGVVPTEFGVLVDRLVSSAELRQAIDSLLAQKRSGAELDSGPRIPAISDYIESELARWDAQDVPASVGHGDTAALDRLFRAALREAWAD